MSSYLWQNFLSDEWAKQHIIETITQMQSDFDLDNVIEIWPGQGALTEGLVTLFDRLTLIEMDTKMKPYLEQLQKAKKSEKLKNASWSPLKPLEASWSFEIIRWDILKQWSILTSRTDKAHTLVYGSLPYYITSPIFRLAMIECGHHHGLFIVQKEVGDKIITIARKKSYLRWLLNNEFEVTLTQIIPPHSFTPAPKVHSCVVKLTKLGQPMLSLSEYAAMLVLLDQINGFKRKTLGKIWKMLWHNNIPEQLASKRLEELSWEEMKLLIK